MSEKQHFFRLIPAVTRIDFARLRFVLLAVSFLLIAGSTIEYKLHGLHLGIEFSGGADIQIRFDEDLDTGALREGLEVGGIEGASVQTIAAAPELNLKEGLTTGTAAGATSPEFLVKVKSNEGEPIAQTVKRVRDALSAKFGPPRTTDVPEGSWEVRRQESASPSAVAELTRKGFDAVWFVTICIFFYIVLRFSQIDYVSAVGYGVGAIVALFHDILVVFSAFVITDKEITLPVVAGMLTVIGYSLNDTIVIYDRIRENHGRYRARDLWETVNKSVNESLSRTIITSGTTLLVLLALFVLGGSVIHDFAFVLIVGIVTGTYSSVFIASPFFVWTTHALRRFKRSRAATPSTKTPRV